MAEKIYFCRKHNCEMSLRVSKRPYCPFCESEKIKSWRKGDESLNLSQHYLYKTWDGMVQRCCNPNDARYYKYGARGINVYDVWLVFSNFLEDVVAEIGEKPTSNHSLDRIDNNGDYKPGNIKWSTRSEQQRNRRNTWWVELDGIRMSIQEAAEKTELFPISSGKILGKLYKNPRISFLVNDAGSIITLQELSNRTGLDVEVLRFRASKRMNVEYLIAQKREVPTYLYKDNYYTSCEIAMIEKINSRMLTNRLIYGKMTLAEALESVKSLASGNRLIA